MRLSGTKTSSVNQYNGLGDQLYDLGGARPTLDLNFSSNESLVDSVTGKTLVDHTRQSSATYVDGDGVIRTAVTNLFLQSEDFSTTWTKPISVTITVNQTTAPDGSLTADLIEGTGNNNFVNQPISLVSGTTYTISAYIKSAGLSKDTFRLFGDSIQFSDNFTATSSWQRFEFTFTATATGTRNGFVTRDSSDNPLGIYIWGAQLEQSSTVGQYVKTTTAINSAPRFDHDPTTGESLGLLVEESRTNLLTYSEDLSGYTKNSITTPLDSSVINPTGSTGSYKILADSGLSGGDPGGIRINQSASSANSIVVSAFVKKSTYRYVYIGFGGLGNSFAALFDIEPGLTSNRLLGQGGNGTYTNIDAGYQNFSNDWIRIWAVGTTSGTNGPTVGMSPDSTTFAITNWTAAGTEEIYAWGLQYEDNVSFPTSYIPTEGSTVTRAADVASITGTNFSSWYNDSEGTVFSDFVVNGDNGSNQFIYDIAEGSAIAEEIFAFKGTSTDDTTHTVRSNSNIEANIASDNQSNFNAQIKSAFAVSATSTIAAVNRSLGTLAESVTMPTVDNLRIGQRSNSTFQGNFSLSRFTYWPTRLSNDTLQTITT